MNASMWTTIILTVLISGAAVFWFYWSGEVRRGKDPEDEPSTDQD